MVTSNANLESKVRIFASAIILTLNDSASWLDRDAVKGAVETSKMLTEFLEQQVQKLEA